MATIPLPALHVNPPADPLDSINKAMSLRSLMQGQQIQGQQIQENQLKLKQQQQQQQDQQAVMQALSQTQGDMSKALPMLAGKISPQTMEGLQKFDLEHQQELRTKTKEENELGEARASKLAALTQQAQALPPDQYQQAWSQIAQQALSIEPKLKDHVNPNQPIPQEQLQALQLGFVTQAQYHAQATAQIQANDEKRKAAMAPFQQKGAEAEAELKTKEAQMGGTNPEMIELNDYLKKNPGKTPIDFAKYKASLAPQAQINVQGGAPSDQLVQAVANGSMKIADVLTPRTPLPIRKQFLGAVLQANPQFNSATYDVEKGVMKDFTSGPDAQKLQAFNTAITHMGVFRDLADKLNNTDIQVLNKVGNTFGVQFGSDKVSNFNIAKQAFIGEVGRAFDGSGVTQGDRNKIEESANAAQSPSQLKGVADTAEKLLRGKRDVLKQQYDAGRQGNPNFAGSNTPTPANNSSDPFAQFGGKAKQ